MPLLALLATTAIADAQADNGSDIVGQLNQLYYSTRKDCGAPEHPAYLCSGLLIEATQPAPGQAFYAVDPAQQARGSASLSYLRKDAKFSRLAGQAKSGFVFRPPMQAPASPAAALDVRCAFPVAGQSETRDQGGCGDSSATPLSTEDYCDRMGIATGSQWLSYYRRIGGTPGGQCGFDVRAKAPNAAKRFMQHLAAIRGLGAEALASPNEMVASPWAAKPSTSPQIVALFHVDKAAVRESRLNQIQWYLASGGWRLPIVGMRLPQAVTQEAKFSYDDADQAIYPAARNSCEQYFERAEWIVRHDVGFGRDIPALSITPTACGRSIQMDQVNNFMNELVVRYYADPQWIGHADNAPGHIEAMRRQLICHLEIARGKDRYNLEPSRPLLEQSAINAAGCNNS